jgi:hypothetical protein
MTLSFFTGVPVIRMDGLYNNASSYSREIYEELYKRTMMRCDGVVPES